MEEGYSRKGDDDDEVCPKLLDLIPKEKEWHVNRKNQQQQQEEEKEEETKSEQQKLELRLAPPGEQQEDSSLLSLAFLSHNNNTRGFLIEENSWINGPKVSKSLNSKVLLSSGWSPNSQSLPPVMGKESLLLQQQQQQQSCSNRLAVVDLQKNAEKKQPGSVNISNNTAVPNSSQKRYSHLFLYCFTSCTEYIHTTTLHIITILACGPYLIFLHTYTAFTILSSSCSNILIYWFFFSFFLPGFHFYDLY